MENTEKIHWENMQNSSQTDQTGNPRAVRQAPLSKLFLLKCSFMKILKNLEIYRLVIQSWEHLVNKKISVFDIFISNNLLNSLEILVRYWKGSLGQTRETLAPPLQ